VLNGKRAIRGKYANSNISFSSENYNTMLQAFLETHDEANRLADVNNRLRGLNNWLDTRVNSLEEELEKVKTDFEHLNMIFRSSNYKGVSSKPSKCENCEVLQAKVKYLVKTSSNLVMGMTNLDAALGSQNYVFDKAGIGYKPMFKKKTRKFSSFLKHSSQHTSHFQTCFYCLHKGHTIKNCRVRLSDVPCGLLRWICKGSINSSRHKANRVPIFIK